MDINNLSNHVNKQLENILIFNGKVDSFVLLALERAMKCFSYSVNKYYISSEFDVFHSGKYSIFLYYLSNSIYKEDPNNQLAEKIYYLNKILHSVDWFYAIDLPLFWGVEHPVGSVLGRAKYSNGLFLYQGCTVGGNKGKYPSLGPNVILYANSTVLGDSKIGRNVIVSAGTIIKDEIIPDNCLVFGQSPNLIIKKKSQEFMIELISKFWVIV